MKFKIEYGDGKEKIINAKNLDEAEEKAPKSCKNIYFLNKEDWTDHPDYKTFKDEIKKGKIKK